MDLDVSYEWDQGLGHNKIVNVTARFPDFTSGLVGMHDRSIDRVCETGIYERLGWHVKVAIEDKWELPSPRDGCHSSQYVPVQAPSMVRRQNLNGGSFEVELLSRETIKRHFPRLMTARGVQ